MIIPWYYGLTITYYIPPPLTVHFPMTRSVKYQPIFTPYISRSRVSSTGGCRGEASPPKPSIFPPKVIHEKYLVIHEKYLVTRSHSCYIISFRVFLLYNTVCAHYAISKYPKVVQNKLITCQYKVPTKVGVLKDSKEFFPPKQKILDETLATLRTRIE